MQPTSKSSAVAIFLGGIAVIIYTTLDVGAPQIATKAPLIRRTGRAHSVRAARLDDEAHPLLSALPVQVARSMRNNEVPPTSHQQAALENMIEESRTASRS